MMRFSNYPELRHELARMFGLEGQLEDPSSGWQLIFVDRENDWLLLGDDPWEYVHSTFPCFSLFFSCVRSQNE